MQETLVPILADIETVQILDELVAKGLLEELVAVGAEDLSLRMTPKGVQFLEWAQELIPAMVHD